MQAWNYLNKLNNNGEWRDSSDICWSQIADFNLKYEILLPCHLGSNSSYLNSSSEESMSHFNTLRSKLSDAEILKASLQDLGLVFTTHADVRGDHGQRVQADIVVTLPGNCDLGWIQNEKGSFDLIADLWGVSRHNNLSQLLNAINQKYAINQTLAAAKQSGLQQAKVHLVVQPAIA